MSEARALSGPLRPSQALAQREGVLVRLWLLGPWVQWAAGAVHGPLQHGAEEHTLEALVGAAHHQHVIPAPSAAGLVDLGPVGADLDWRRGPRAPYAALGGGRSSGLS